MLANTRKVWNKQAYHDASHQDTKDVQYKYRGLPGTFLWIANDRLSSSLLPSAGHFYIDAIVHCYFHMIKAIKKNFQELESALAEGRSQYHGWWS